MLLPDLWAKAISGLGLEHRSQSLLGKAFKNKNKTVSAVLIGLALGPVFSSCSLTYAWVIATVLPSNTALGLLYLTIYVLGVATSLLAIALLGRKLLEKVKWASDPRGWFQRVIAILFIIVGLFIITGWDKNVQTWLVDKDYLNLIQIEKKLVPSKDSDSSRQTTATNSDKVSFNVDPYRAPELRNIATWINSDPQTVANLKGKVVLVDFWTYSCINCIRTQPYLNSWYDKYKDKGLVIIGIHAPEFAFERVPENVKQAVIDAKIGYPVGLDNDFTTWKAYNNQYWPAKYLIDKDGLVRFTHFGEGKYDETESAIQSLLKEAGSNVNMPIQTSNDSQIPSNLTPETYLGYERGERFANGERFKNDEIVNYPNIPKIETNQWSLSGNWKVGKLDTLSTGGNSRLQLRYTAKEVYLVMSGDGKRPARLMLNGQSLTAKNGGGSDVDINGNIFPKEARLYRLVKSENLTKDALLEIQLPEGTTINAFTFGG